MLSGRGVRDWDWEEEEEEEDGEEEDGTIRSQLLIGKCSKEHFLV